MKNWIMIIMLMMVVLLTGCAEQVETDLLRVDIAIEKAYVLDVMDGTYTLNTTVLIDDGIITHIFNDDSVQYAADRVVDGTGLYVLPGFINAHVHVQDDMDQLSLWVQSGVTSIRVLSDWDTPPLVTRRKAWNTDAQTATMLVSTPIITKPNGYGSHYVDSPEEGRETVRQMADMGYDIIKISIEDQLQGKAWSCLNLEETTAIVEEAHQLGLEVTAHVTNRQKLRIAIDAGVDEIAHMVFDRIPDEMLVKMVEKNIRFNPTLELWKGVQAHHGGYAYKIAKDNLKRFHQLGGIVVFGTDFGGYFTGFDTAFPMTEVIAMQESGISNAEIIKSATYHAAHSSGKADILGTINVGKTADLILCDQDPLMDMGALMDLDYVIHLGEVIVEPSEIS